MIANICAVHIGLHFSVSFRRGRTACTQRAVLEIDRRQGPRDPKPKAGPWLQSLADGCVYSVHHLSKSPVVPAGLSHWELFLFLLESRRLAFRDWAAEEGRMPCRGEVSEDFFFFITSHIVNNGVGSSCWHQVSSPGGRPWSLSTAASRPTSAPATAAASATPRDRCTGPAVDGQDGAGGPCTGAPRGSSPQPVHRRQDQCRSGTEDECR